MTAARKILYVATPQSLSDTRRMVMEHAGYKVRVAPSADDASAVLREEKFDLVVVGNSIATTMAEKIVQATTANPARPLLISLDNRSGLKTDFTLRAMAGPEELLAVLGEALIRSHGHEVPEDGCYMFVDENRRYIHVTDAATELLGYERGELIGRTIDQISAPEMDVSSRFEAYVENGFQKGTFRLRRQDGSIVNLAYSAEVLPDGCMVSRLTPAKSSAAVPHRRKQPKLRPL